MNRKGSPKVPSAAEERFIRSPAEMFWDEQDSRVKANGPTSAEHPWELLQSTHPNFYPMDLFVPRATKIKGVKM